MPTFVHYSTYICFLDPHQKINEKGGFKPVIRVAVGLKQPPPPATEKPFVSSASTSLSSKPAQ
eukprot:8720286-Pyramimonas_sp.AAC.1